MHVPRRTRLRPATMPDLDVGMNRSAPRFATTTSTTTVAVPIGAVLLLLRVLVVFVLLVALAFLVPGFVLDAPQPAPVPSDAIVVISGDEQMARFAEGVNLYQQDRKSTRLNSSHMS